MSAYAWLSKLNVLPDASCRCDHLAKEHLHGKSCGHEDAETFKFCKCEEFREAKIKVKIQTGEDDMAKNKKTKVASKPRGSNLLYFIDKERVAKFDDGRLLDKKTKTYSAVIAQYLVAAGKDGVSFDSIAAAVSKAVEHKNEATLRRNIRWYFSSKRSDVAKFITSERVEATNAAKPKPPRKPRAKKPSAAAKEPPTTMAERQAEAATA